MQSGFVAYLTSTANSAFAPELADRYQDMTQPLTSYYIDSSHNTYLVGRLFVLHMLLLLDVVRVGGVIMSI